MTLSHSKSGATRIATMQAVPDIEPVAFTMGAINVNISANRQYTQVGSDVMTPAGDVTITAPSATIQKARETSQSSIEQQFKQSGISIGINNPLSSAGQTAQSLGQAAGNTSDPRMQALAAAAAGLNGYNTYKSLTDDAGKFSAEKARDIRVNISIGSSKSQSNSNSQSDRARGSTVAAGKDINIQATGANQDSNLTVQGSQVQAGNYVTLNANNQVNLLAAQNTASQTSSNSSSSSSVGVSYSPASGWGVNASASRGHGSGNGEDTSYTNTNVQAGNTASLNSGSDTTVKGAVVAANTVKANVGGNLAVESLQDTSTYTSRQSSSGGSISFGGGKLTGGGISVGRSHIDSNFASVNQTSGIQAGDGGFQVGVNNNTDLKGAVIASTQAAIDQNRNTFITGGTLTTSDIQNSAEYKGEAIAVSASIGPKNTDPKGNTTYLPGVGFGIGGDKGSASSTTTAGISGIAGNTVVRTGDAQTGIAPIFDAGKVQREIDAQVQITQEFGKDASKAVGDYAQAQEIRANSLRTQAQAIAQSDPQGADALNAQAEQIENNWGNNGILRLAAHTAIGGLTGGASGALGAAAGTLTAPAVDRALREAGITGPLASTLTALASTAVGAATGGTAGAGAALNEVANNFLGHKDRAELDRLRSQVKNRQGLSREEAIRLVVLDASDQMSDGLLTQYRNGQPLTAEQTKNLNIYLGAYALQNGNEAAQRLVSQGVAPIAGYPYAGTKDMQMAYTQGMSWSDWLLGHSQSVNERINTDARIQAQLYLNTAPNESFLPTAQAQSNRYATLDALANSPVLATGTYLVGTAIGASPDKLNAATQIASVLSDIGSSFVLPRAGISPVLGQTSVGAKAFVNLTETQATLTNQIADLRATLTGNARTGGNMGVAQIDIPGIQPTMATSSQIDAPSVAQAASGFVGKIPETFPSSVVVTGGSKPFPLLRDVDSEAKILNNVAAKLGDNTSVTGTINLLTERAPCVSCSNVIDLFTAKYPNITVNVFDNNGNLIPPTKKVP